MFNTYVARPLLVKAVQFQDGMQGQLTELFPRSFTQHPTLGFCCTVQNGPVPVAAGDWIMQAHPAAKYLIVYTDSQFRSFFMEPGILEG